MELEYRENIDYGNGEPCIDDLAAELAELANHDGEAYEVYMALRKEIEKEIRVRELGITRIMPDLIEIYMQSDMKAVLVMNLLADPLRSYSELGDKMGFTKQRAFVILRDLAKKYVWIGGLLKIRSDRS